VPVFGAGFIEPVLVGKDAGSGLGDGMLAVSCAWACCFFSFLLLIMYRIPKKVPTPSIKPPVLNRIIFVVFVIFFFFYY
jgi:hypothetical protein